jgi:hypothetical protein
MPSLIMQSWHLLLLFFIYRTQHRSSNAIHVDPPSQSIFRSFHRGNRDYKVFTVTNFSNNVSKILNLTKKKDLNMSGNIVFQVQTNTLSLLSEPHRYLMTRLSFTSLFTCDVMYCRHSASPLIFWWSNLEIQYYIWPPSTAALPS